jgi:hypothetical protein
MVSAEKLYCTTLALPLFFPEIFDLFAYLFYPTFLNPASDLGYTDGCRANTNCT